MGSGLNNFLMDFFVDDGSLLIQIQTLRSNNACTKELIFDKRTGITASREKVLVLSFNTPASGVGRGGVGSIDVQGVVRL